jgi:hypothetical protein
MENSEAIKEHLRCSSCVVGRVGSRELHFGDCVVYQPLTLRFEAYAIIASPCSGVFATNALSSPALWSLPRSVAAAEQTCATTFAE